MSDDRTNRERAIQLREMNLSYRQIADELGVSKARVGQYLKPYNPDGRALTYECQRCGHRFRSTARSKPNRCPAEGGCGSVYWNRSADSAAA